MAIQTRYIYLLKYILPITDIVLVNVVYLGAYFMTDDFGKHLVEESNYHHVVVCNLIWLSCVTIFGLSQRNGVGDLEKIYRGTWRSVLLHFGLFAVYLLFSRHPEFSRTFLVFFYGLLCFALLMSRFIGTFFQYLLLNKFNATRKVAVMGTGSTAVRLAEYFKGQQNVEFNGFIIENESFYAKSGTPLPQTVFTRLAAAVSAGVEDIYVVIDNERMHEVSPLVKEAEHLCLRLKFVPNLGSTSSIPYQVNYLGKEFPVITLRHEPLEDIGKRLKKRVFDVVFSGLVIVFILSWLFPLLALLIKLESRGPVLFKQWRSGRNDNAFLCLKFRSMQVNEESDEKQATIDDVRVTGFGSFLRKTGLDEMPQFFNVFIGDMSVVGPRPHMLKHTEEYKLIINQYMVRHFLKPGITGWAQVNGYRGETKTPRDMQKRVQYDIYYLENWTAMLDVKIVFMTVINGFKGEKNAY